MVVLACEGQCEVKLVSMLLDTGSLIFTQKEILDRRPVHMRQPKQMKAVIETLPFDEEIVFYRIGDTQNDEFDISCFGEARKEKITIHKVCTTPEIEILIIICEGLYHEYLKYKSKVTPKQFVLTAVKDYSSFDEYIKNHDMISAIKEYKRIKKHDKGEMYLADLLK